MRLFAVESVIGTLPALTTLQLGGNALDGAHLTEVSWKEAHAGLANITL